MQYDDLVDLAILRTLSRGNASNPHSIAGDISKEFSPGAIAKKMEPLEKEGLIAVGYTRGWIRDMEIRITEKGAELLRVKTGSPPE